MRSAGAPRPGKFLGHGITDDFTKTIALDRPTCSVPVVAAALMKALGVYQEKHGVAATELRGFSVSMTRLVRTADAARAQAEAGATAHRQQRTIQQFAHPTTASQVRAAIHPRALPRAGDQHAVVDLTDVATQESGTRKLASCHQKRATRGRRRRAACGPLQERLRLLPAVEHTTQHGHIVISDEDSSGSEDEDFAAAAAAARKRRRREAEPEVELARARVPFGVLERVLQGLMVSQNVPASELLMRVLQARLDSLVYGPGMDLVAAAQLLRLLRRCSGQSGVDESWKAATEQLRARASTRAAQAMGLPAGTMLDVE